MTSIDRLERDLPGILEGLYVGPRPAYADDALRAATQTPRGPMIEQLLPLASVSRSVVAMPRFPWRLAGLVALLLLALAATVLFVGNEPEKLPAPFGPAGNGLIAYEYARDIYVGDPATGEATAITSGLELDTNPVFSPDGSRIAFLRSSGYYPVLDDRVDVVTVDPDGSGLRVLTRERRSDIVSCCAWSPDGSTVFIETGVERVDASDPGWWDWSLAALDASRAGDPRTLVSTRTHGAPPPCCGGAAVTSQIARLLRPTNSDRILSVGAGWPHHTITETNLNGRDARPVVTVPSHDLREPAWAPDGTTIAFIAASTAAAPCGSAQCVPEQRAYLLNADGTGLRLLAPRATAPPAGWVTVENGPQWSPDGSRVALWQWTEEVNPPTACCPTDGPRPLPPGGLTIVDVATGEARSLGGGPHWPGLAGWTWSPDGRSLLLSRVEVAWAQYRMIQLDVETGAVTELPWALHSDASWQRVAR